MGDWGTLLPLVIGYIAVNKMDPAGLLVMMGLTNIALGFLAGVAIHYLLQRYTLRERLPWKR